MKKLLFIFFAINLSSATQESMQEMLARAKSAFSTQQTVNATREAQFLDRLTAQNNLLASAKKEMQLLKKESLHLNSIIDTNEKVLASLEEKLHQRSGNLGELYGVVRQSAGDLYAQLLESPTSALFPDRLEFLQKLSKTKKLPATQKLTHFWYLMLEELSIQGKVWHIEAPLIATNGKGQKASILLNGPFASIHKEGFVQYLPQSRNFALLAKQPSGSLLSTAVDAYKADEALFETILDPTRGQLLSLATEAPTFSERVEQGSTVGYLIILIGIFGLGFAAYRAYTLAQIDLSIAKNRIDSPVILLQEHYQTHKSLSLEQLELSIEERLSKAKTSIEKGLAMIKLLAAVSPLMGLLGTVTGMIATFSAITLFGTGDPKLMAGGISQALITTVEGLVVAIPLLFAYTLLSSRTKVILARLDEEALLLLSQHK